jgi:hypothetical protein
MTITYAGITDRPGFSSAFQAFVSRLRLPRQRRHDGNALVAVDLAERPTVAAPSAEGDQPVVAALTARIETLEAEFAKVEAAAAVQRADFERERERCERLMAEVLNLDFSNSISLWRRMKPATAIFSGNKGEFDRVGALWFLRFADCESGGVRLPAMRVLVRARRRSERRNGTWFSPGRAAQEELKARRRYR